MDVQSDQHGLLRRLLVRWLRINGYGKLCKEEPTDHSWRSSRLSVNFLFSILLGLWIYSIVQLSWKPWQGIAAIVGTLLIGAALIGYGRLPPAVVYLFFLALWVLAAFQLVLEQGFDATIPTHLLPLILVPTLRGIGSAARIASQLPLFIPAALIIVLLPLLSEDPWRLAAAARDRLSWFAGLALLPPLALLAWRILRTSPYSILESAAESLSALADHDAIVFKAIKKVHHSNDEKFDEEAVGDEIRSALKKDQPDGAALRILQTARTSLRLRAARRLGSLALGISVIIWVLIYVLAWASMPTSLANEWSKVAVPLQAISVFGIDVALPMGPYLWVSTLLAIVACAGFLGYALTEDQHSDALWNAIVQRPAEEYVIVALSYITAFAAQTIEQQPKRTEAQEVGGDPGVPAPRQRPNKHRGKAARRAKESGSPG